MTALPLIFNPRSGGGKGEALARRAAALLHERDVEVELKPTAGPGGARPLARELAELGATRILAIGGDGTLSEAVDGAFSTGKRPVFGFLPGGTGNSFLIDFGADHLEDAVERVALGRTRELDVGEVTWQAAGPGEPRSVRLFINNFATGFSAEVCDFANRRLKFMGARGYTTAVFPKLVTLRSPRTRLTLDGETFDGEYALVSVANTIHTGGAMKIAPMAVADDGKLEVVALRRVGRVGLLRIFPKIFDGSHIGNPRVLHASAREIEIAPERDGPLLGDGEVYGKTPVRIRVLPRALRVIL